MDKQHTIYIAGPMTGVDNYNFPSFVKKQMELERDGWHVINPVYIGAHLTAMTGRNFDGIDRKVFLEFDLLYLKHFCHAIYMLKGWEQSQGAIVEHNVAIAYNLDIYYEEDE